MRTINGKCSYEYEIKRSRFLCFVHNIGNVADAANLLDDYHKQYADATHICYAYVINNPAAEKCSDDGEPSGTAGKPMLDMIKKQGLSNIIVIVVRYFGGVKLGAGGLVRAYANAVRLALENVEIKDINKYWQCEIIISIDKRYSLENNDNVKIINIDYSMISDKALKVEAAILCNDDVLKSIRGMAKEVTIIREVLM